MTDQMDAMELLTADHRRVEGMFRQLEGTTDPDEWTRIVHEVAHDLAVHGEIEELLVYPRLELMAEVRHHVQEEESDVFPQLRQALGAEELRSLGEALQDAKSLVPTRPHPNAPTGPLGKLAASPPIALVDRVRDAGRRWNNQR